jgi:tetratricopeptide (TPR) repeat protein
MRIQNTLLLFAFLSVVACQNPETNDAEDPRAAKITQPPKPLAQQAVSKSLTDSLDAVLKQEPNNLKALVLRGRKRLAQGNTQNALFDFQRVKKIDSTYAPMLLSLGELYMTRNQSRQAKNAWSNCALANPQDLECRMNLAKIFASVQDYEPALKYLDEIIAIDPYSSNAFLYKGVVVRDAQQDTGLALQYFQKATELDQNNINALDMMGVTLANRGDTTAQYYYKRILKIDPNRADIHYKLGVHYMNVDEINRAIESYTSATQINPQDADSYYNLGHIFTVTVKDYTEALKYYNKSIRAESKYNYKAFFGRGYVYEMQGDVKRAEADYLKTLELLPVYQPARDALARLKS